MLNIDLNLSSQEVLPAELIVSERSAYQLGAISTLSAGHENNYAIVFIEPHKRDIRLIRLVKGRKPNTGMKSLSDEDIGVITAKSKLTGTDFYKGLLRLAK